MSTTTTVTRGTGMPGSDVKESQRLTAKIASGWLVSSVTVSANATAASFIAANMFINGRLYALTAGTVAMTGTLAASTTGAFIVAAANATAVRTFVCAGAASVGAIAFAETSSNSELPLGMIVIACTATAFNGGTNSLADSSYAVSFINFTGPTGLAIATEHFSTVPG